MTVRRQYSAMSKKRKKNNCTAHPMYEMALVSQRELAMALGTVVEMEPRSRRERLRRKKYMGEWRQWSQAMAVMMSPLPRRAAR